MGVSIGKVQGVGGGGGGGELRHRLLKNSKDGI